MESSFLEDSTLSVHLGNTTKDAHGDCKNWTLNSGTTVCMDDLRPGISCTCVSMTYCKDEQWIPFPAPRSLLMLSDWP